MPTQSKKLCLAFILTMYDPKAEKLALVEIDESSRKHYEDQGWYVLPETHEVQVTWTHAQIRTNMVDRLQKERTRVQAEAVNKVTNIDRQINRLLALEHNGGVEVPLPDGLVDDDMPF